MATLCNDALNDALDVSHDQLIAALREIELAEKQALTERDQLRDELHRVLPQKLFQIESVHSALLQARAKLRERLGIAK